MRIVGFITRPAVIKRILDHLQERNKPARPPRTAHRSNARVRSLPPTCRGEERRRRCRAEAVALAFTRGSA